MRNAKNFDDYQTRLAIVRPGQASQSSQSTRIRTRILHRGNPCRAGGDDIFDQGDQTASTAKSSFRGSITVVGGPDQGKLFELSDLYLRVGRSESQEIQLLNDDAVSRESHAIIGFVPDSRRFIIIDGGKVNPVLVNGAVVQDAAFLKDGDILKIGESELCLTTN